MKSITKKSGILAAVSVCLAVAVTVAYTSDGAHLKISPDQINLNVKNKGQFQDVQAIVSAAMPSGYSIGDYDVTLAIDGVSVADAFAFRYCYIDNNYLASFDRETVQAYLQSQYPSGGVCTAQVDISFTAVNSDGDTQTVQFTSGTDEITVIKPGK